MENINKIVNNILDGKDIKKVISDSISENTILNEMPTLASRFKIGNVTFDYLTSDQRGKNDHENEPHFHVYFYVSDPKIDLEGTDIDSEGRISSSIRLDSCSYTSQGNEIELCPQIRASLRDYLLKDSQDPGGEDCGYNNWQQLALWWETGARKRGSNRKRFPYKDLSRMPEYLSLPIISEDEFVIELLKKNFIPEKEIEKFKLALNKNYLFQE